MNVGISRTSRVAVGVLACSLHFASAGSLTARAADPVPIPAPVPVSGAAGVGGGAISPENDTHAKELFLQGDRAYSEGRYESARDAFQEAYKLSNRPQLLYNLANAYERLGRFADAVATLQKYLELVKPKDRGTMERRIQSMNERLEVQKREREQTEREVAAREQKEREQREAFEAERARRDSLARPPKTETRSPLPWVFIGGGVAFAAAGAVFGGLALTARGDAKDACRELPGGLLCSASAEKWLQQDATFSVLADIGFGVGIAAVVTGTVLLITRGKPRTEGVTLLVPGRNHEKRSAASVLSSFQVDATRGSTIVGFGTKF
jgi:hypothetical protein